MVILSRLWDSEALHGRVLHCMSFGFSQAGKVCVQILRTHLSIKLNILFSLEIGPNKVLDLLFIDL